MVCGGAADGVGVCAPEFLLIARRAKRTIHRDFVMSPTIAQIDDAARIYSYRRLTSAVPSQSSHRAGVECDTRALASDDSSQRSWIDSASWVPRLFVSSAFSAW